MKSEGFVERKFVASLHKALEELAPEQLEVFEKWFDPADRRPRYHIAPVIGVVGYLRKTPPLYRKIMEQAGHYASQWSCLDLPQLERKFIQFGLPFGRDRLLRHLLRFGLRSIHRDGELDTFRNGSKLVVTVANSLFCRTGGPGGDEPTCMYYAALFGGLLEIAQEKCSSVIESSCRGLGDSACRFEALP